MNALKTLSAQKLASLPMCRSLGIFPNQRIVSPKAKGASLIPKEYSKVVPSGDFVLAKFEEEEDFTEGKIWVPESLKAKPNLAEVVDVGTGRADDGSNIDFEVKPGDVVLYTRFGTVGVKELELEANGDTYAIIKNEELAGKLPSMDDYQVDDFEPLSNFILVKSDGAQEETLGGIMLTETTQERPNCGKVVKVGPGLIKDGERKPVLISPGENVMYGKYAGDELEDEDGSTYVVLKEV